MTFFDSAHNLSREQIRSAVCDAFVNPEAGELGGRPRASRAAPLAQKVLVVREAHADGSYHFHAAIKLSAKMRLAAAKRTLMNRHCLCSHFSSSHVQSA